MVGNMYYVQALERYTRSWYWQQSKVLVLSFCRIVSIILLVVSFLQLVLIVFLFCTQLEYNVFNATETTYTTLG